HVRARRDEQQGRGERVGDEGAEVRQEGHGCNPVEAAGSCLNPVCTATENQLVETAPLLHVLIRAGKKNQEPREGQT
ncbi:MAG: hypothetical protein ACJ8AR_01380, partial [Microvirga sp.]